MALPTVAEVKNYLRIQTSAQDSVITDLLASGKSWAESLIGRRITATSEVMSTLWAGRDCFRQSVIYLPFYPVNAAGLVLTDADGETVPADDYTVDGDAGKLTATEDSWFSNAPYEATAEVGLSAGSGYSGKEPGLRALIIGLTAILYHQSNPNASSDSAGGGVSVSYQSSWSLPPHLNTIVMSFRGMRVA
jgi:uncharacterized phiE125 gp8 family phage protein